MLTTPGALCTTDPDNPDLFTHYLLDEDGVLRFKEGHRHLPNAWCHLDTSYFRKGDWAWDGASDATQLAHDMPDIGAEDIYFHVSDTYNNTRIVRECVMAEFDGEFGVVAVGAQVWTMAAPIAAGVELQLEWGPQAYGITPGAFRVGPGPFG